MTKYICFLLVFCSLLLGGCQSVEQLSIDYMLPADVSFPESLKRVAVVNNMPDAPDNELIADKDTVRKKETEIARRTMYFNGDPRIATESLARALADENYFNEVVICDSALRAKDITPRESTLTKEEINNLVRNLDVDFLIALENVQVSALYKIDYIPEWNTYYGTVDAKVYPTVKVYLPNRRGPMVIVNNNDSIFWEEFGTNEGYIRSHLINEKDMIKEASDFAGQIPVKHLLPHWKTAHRYLFTGGSVNMRDAAVYVREKQWDKAIGLWKQTYDTKKGKQKMYAAYNLAVGYEMQDSIELAADWALKAQAQARIVDGVDKRNLSQLDAGGLPNYVLTTLYANELQTREEGMLRLNVQMGRFKDDF